MAFKKTNASYGDPLNNISALLPRPSRNDHLFSIRFPPESIATYSAYKRFHIIKSVKSRDARRIFFFLRI